MDENRTLYDPRFEHDACGVGFVARTSGRADHAILAMALEAVDRLSHRGAVAADGVSGDGAGVLTQIPRGLLVRDLDAGARERTEGGLLGVGMAFFPADDPAPEAVLAESLTGRGLEVVGWRTVPVDPGALGERAREGMPRVRQVLVIPGHDQGAGQFERELYLARKQFERRSPGGYVCSLSCRTVVYKALCAARQLPRFYLDLADPAYETAVALFHQRYSTNTLPSWPLAQPLRMAAHNGEINTLWGNRGWMRARARDLPAEVQPVLDPTGSDSTSLDETLELLSRTGREVEHALRMLIVPAWEETDRPAPELTAFYRYHSPIMEPWDGPAALAFTDGRVVGAALDRNGLRPCRYKITADGLVVAGSEVGLFDLDEDVVVERGRLGPGQLLLVDLERGEVVRDAAVGRRLAAGTSYAEWAGARPLRPATPATPTPASPATPVPAAADGGDGEAGANGGPGVGGALPLAAGRSRLFGVTAEDVKFVMEPMVDGGK